MIISSVILVVKKKERARANYLSSNLQKGSFLLQSINHRIMSSSLPVLTAKAGDNIIPPLPSDDKNTNNINNHNKNHSNASPSPPPPSPPPPSPPESRVLQQEEEQQQLAQEVQEAHQLDKHNALYLTITNTYAAVIVFVFYLLTLESWIGIGLSVGLTVYVYDRTADDDVASFDGGNMNWILLSFAAISPVSSAVRFAFGRREAALVQMAVLRSSLLDLYSAHAEWDWGSNGSGRGKVCARCPFYWKQ